MSNVQPNPGVKLDSSAAVIVNSEFKMVRITADAPLNKQVFLGSKEAGSCYKGIITAAMLTTKPKPGDPTHWGPYPTFED